MNSIEIGLSVSTPTVEEGRRAIEESMARLRAAGLDIEWRKVRDVKPIGGFAGAHVGGTLRLYDTPETVAAKVTAANDLLEQAIDQVLVGRRFVDSDGCTRVSNRWGFNSYATIEDVRRALRPFSIRHRRRLHGKTWHIWRLADGTFDYTASAHPDTLPGHPAELVETYTA